MELLAILKIIPIILSVVEVIKRFIPDKQRTYANPAIAIVTGILGAYTVGGIGEVLTVLMTGLLAACGAIGAYKIPKELGTRLGIN